MHCDCCLRQFNDDPDQIMCPKCKPRKKAPRDVEVTIELDFDRPEDLRAWRRMAAERHDGKYGAPKLDADGRLVGWVVPRKPDAHFFQVLAVYRGKLVQRCAHTVPADWSCSDCQREEAQS